MFNDKTVEALRIQANLTVDAIALKYSRNTDRVYDALTMSVYDLAIMYSSDNRLRTRMELADRRALNLAIEILCATARFLEIRR